MRPQLVIVKAEKESEKEMAIIKLTDDWVFRYTYGAGTEESNKALVALLNTVLGREDNPISPSKSTIFIGCHAPHGYG